jgi:hypothetical protein
MTFSVVTPSYFRDYDRCVLLNESIKRWVPDTVRHCIIVDKRDYKMFAGLADGRTQVLTQESVVPKRFWPVPFSRKWRLSWNTLPMRGWIWQQLVKLSIATAVDSDAYMMVDSDVFFVKPFDPNALVRDGKVPLFRENKDYYTSAVRNQQWHASAHRILGLPPRSVPYSTGYVGPHVFWRRDTLQRLNDQLTRGRLPGAWLRQIGRLLTFSEYVLYGVFVETKEGLSECGHYFFDKDICHNYWPEVTLSVDELRAFRDEMPEEKVLVMINAKSNTPPESIRRVFFEGG